MSTKQIFKVINDNFGRISEDIIRLQKWGYIERSPIKIYCELGERASWFYSRTEKAYEGYEYLQKVSKEIDLEKALDEHKARARIQREGLRDKEGKEVYIKVPGNPNATIVMNSNRPAGFYSYQKRRPSVNRGIGSSFSMFEGATDGL